jgi:hypothetical protein
VDLHCGPLLTVGPGGTSADLRPGRTHCLVPASEADLDDLLAGLPGGPAVRDVVRRLAWLAEQVPELAEAEINPLVVDGDAVAAVDVRVRLAPAGRAEPWIRSLPV